MTTKKTPQKDTFEFENTSDAAVMLSDKGTFSMCVKAGEKVTVPDRLKVAAVRAQAELKEAEVIAEAE